jgi:hypothetical protein
MQEHCAPTNYERIGAIYTYGRLIVWARVTTPNQFYSVKIRKSPRRILPPHYELLACTTGFIPMIFNPTTRYAVGIFETDIHAGESYVTVITEKGDEQVPLITIPDFDLSSAETAEGGVPGIFKTFGVPGIFRRAPIRLEKVFEAGDQKDVGIFSDPRDWQLVEATGYSENFSFDEAFQDAIRSLPPDPNPFPDKLTFVNVENTRAEFGGIAGLNRLAVKVSCVY